MYGSFVCLLFCFSLSPGPCPNWDPEVVEAMEQAEMAGGLPGGEEEDQLDLLEDDFVLLVGERGSLILPPPSFLPSLLCVSFVAVLPDFSGCCVEL